MVPLMKKSKISETGVAMPTKNNFHAFHMDLYGMNFFNQFYFLTPWTIIDSLKGKLFLAKYDLKQQYLQNWSGHAH